MKLILVTREDFLNTYRYRKFGERALGKYGRLFPVKSSPNLAEIVAALITDGHLQKKIMSTGRSQYTYFALFSKDRDDLKRFSTKIMSVFGINGNVRKWGVRQYGNSYGCIFIDSVVCRILELCGVPFGDKTNKCFDVPCWVKTSSNENIKKLFIRECFDRDGSIRYDENRNRWKITFSMVKTEDAIEGGTRFLLSLKSIMRSLKIETTNVAKSKKIENIRKDGSKTRSLWFDVASSSIPDFCKMMGSNKKDKLKRINSILERQQNNNLRARKLDGTKRH